MTVFRASLDVERNPMSLLNQDASAYLQHDSVQLWSLDLKLA